MRIAYAGALKPAPSSGLVSSFRWRLRRLAGILRSPPAVPGGEESLSAPGLAMELETLRRTVERQRVRIAELERLADEDVLAPVANRRAFERELVRQAAHDARNGACSAVIYIDLDGLKRINDTHGHAAGDAAITEVATILQANVRESDLVARLGGDEFGLLLAGADVAAASEKACALARRVSLLSLYWNGITIPLSVSFGVHALGGADGMAAALAAADKAMYAHKRGLHRGGAAALGNRRVCRQAIISGSNLA